MLPKHRFGPFLIAVMLLIGGLFLAAPATQAHGNTPLATPAVTVDCTDDMADMTQHCCVSTACINVAIFTPRFWHHSLSRTQIHSQTDRYERADMFMPGVDIPPPRLLS